MSQIFDALKQFLFTHFCCLLIVECGMKKGYSAGRNAPAGPEYVHVWGGDCESDNRAYGHYSAHPQKKSKNVPLERPSKKTHRLSFVR